MVRPFLAGHPANGFHHAGFPVGIVLTGFERAEMSDAFGDRF